MSSPRRPRPTPCHAGQEARERRRVDRLDLVAHRRERAAAQHAQHARVAELALDTSRPELAEHDPPVGLEAHECIARSRRRHTEATGDLFDHEGTMRARVATDEVVERRLDRVRERGRQSGWQRDAERVAQARRVLGRRVALARTHDAMVAQQLFEPGFRIRSGAGAQLVEVQRPEVGEEIVEVVGMARPAVLRDALQLELEIREHGRIEELAQFFGAEQVAQEIAVEGQCGRTTLGERRVAFVHVDGDPAEQQRLRER